MDDKMIRKNIYLTQDQSEFMRLLAFEERTTESDLIRQAIDAYITKYQKAHRKTTKTAPWEPEQD